MAKLTNKRVVAVKIETVSGVAETMANGDAILVENLSHSYVNSRMVERPLIRTTSFGKLAACYAGSLVQLSFDVEIKGSGTAGTAPEAGPLLEIAGHNLTTVAVTSNTYNIESNVIKTATVQFDYDGVSQILTGCIANVSTSIKAGGIAKDSFTIIGHYNNPVDGSVLSPTYDLEKPGAVLGLSLTVDGDTMDAAAIEWNHNNDTAPVDSLGTTDGFGQLEIVGRGITGSFDPLALPVATHDFVGKWAASESMAVSDIVIGSGAGSVVTITIPQLQYTAIPMGDRNNRITKQINFMLNETSGGNDEVTRVYT